MSLGALIGKETNPITEEEHQQLSECLVMLRSTNAANEVLKTLLMTQRHHDGPPETTSALISEIAFHYTEQHTPEAVEGVLIANREPDSVYSLDKKSLETLRNLLMIRERGGWLADFLDRKIPEIAKGKTPRESAPTPLELIADMTWEADEFDCESEIAQRMVDRRPDLFKPSNVPAPETAQEAPAEPTPIKESTKTPAATHRTRKPRKKAA